MTHNKIHPNPKQASTAITAIKGIHTLIFAGMGSCVVYILYSGLRGRITRLSKISFAVTLAEAAIFFGNGSRCPLTDIVEDLGSEHGSVGDIFLPDWFARRIPVISSTMIAIGLISAGLHHMLDGNQHSEKTPLAIG